jgi:hypothetical protein
MEVVCFTLRQSLPSRSQGPIPTQYGVARTPQSLSGLFTENWTTDVQSVARIHRLSWVNSCLPWHLFIINKLNRRLAEWFAERLENIFCLSNICRVESWAKQLCQCLLEGSCPITGQMARHHRDWRQTALELMKNGGHVARSIKQLTIDPQSLIQSHVLLNYMRSRIKGHSAYVGLIESQSVQLHCLITQGRSTAYNTWEPGRMERCVRALKTNKENKRRLWQPARRRIK